MNEHVSLTPSRKTRPDLLIGYELQLGTNNVAPCLFTKVLTPILIETAKSAPKGSVRVVWVSSSAAKGLSPTNGVEMDNLGYEREDKGPWFKYGVSKAGNILHCLEFARRYGKEGILSIVSTVSKSYLHDQSG